MFKKKNSIDKDAYIWTFTKRWINRLLFIGCIWITWSYALATVAAMHGKYTVVENLSKTVCTVIIASVLGYLTKSFFETYSEQKNKLVSAGYDKYSSTNVTIDDTDTVEDSIFLDSPECEEDCDSTEEQMLDETELIDSEINSNKEG